jgi:hypothetical protein
MPSKRKHDSSSSSDSEDSSSSSDSEDNSSSSDSDNNSNVIRKKVSEPGNFSNLKKIPKPSTV